MTIAEHTQIEITDRETTFRFNDHAHTALDDTSYAPPSPDYKTSTLGSRTLVHNAVEQIGFNLFLNDGEDDSVIDGLRETLDTLLFNAVRYGLKRDRSVSPVLFRIIKQGSNKWLAAQLTGSNIRTILPNDFVLKARVGEANVTVELERYGELVLDGYMGENLISTNSSFEIYAGAGFPGWTQSVPSGVFLARVTSIATFDGSYSAQIYFNGGSNPGIYQEKSGLTPGTTYRASVYAICPADSGDEGYIMLSETGGANPVSTVIPIPTLTRTRFSVTKVCPADGILRVSLLVAGAIDAYIEVDAVLLEVDTGSPGTYSNLTAAGDRQGTSDSTTNALDILTSTFSTSQTQSGLVELTLEGYVNDQSLLRRSFLAFAKDPLDMHLFTTGLGGTQAASSGNNESGGQISTFAATGTMTKSGALNLPSTLRGRKIEVIIMARNNATSGEVYASAWVHNPNSPSVGAFLGATESSPQAAVIPAIATESGGTAVIRPYYCGILQSSTPIESIFLSFLPTATGGVYTTTVDSVLVINRDDDLHSGILVLESSLDSYVYSSFTASSTLTLKLDPKTLTDRYPFFGFTETDGTNEVEVPHRGDKNIRTTGGEIAICWMYSNGTKWAPVGTLAFTAVRDLVYKTPV
jgi:hypothetical protein